MSFFLAGLLADPTVASHGEDLEAHDIGTIDLVACNLYPFQSNPGIGNIDIGGIVTRNLLNHNPNPNH